MLVLGDQLWLGHPALQEFDPTRDRVLMIEAPGEARHVWSHQARIAIFLAAMRHFREAIAQQGWPCLYLELDDASLPDGFDARLQWALERCAPGQLEVCEPGEWRMLAVVQQASSAAQVPLRVWPDTHFLCTREEFARWAGTKRELRMEFFYREMRRRHRVLMEGDEPVGGRWNYDVENRRGYPRQGPGLIPPPVRFDPDPITQDVLRLVGERFGDHPCSLAHFAWPVTRDQALAVLHDFVGNRLAGFGPFQDAMWTDTPWGWHALLSSSLNLHLITPAEVVAAAEQAWRERALPLPSVEGFIRQVLGWREFIRGVYWLDMPQLAQANHFGHDRPLPSWYWTGETRMNCMRQAIGQTLAHGFAHHIQRLMVTGQFAVLARLSPQQVCDWYLAVYVDAVEWVELPNTAGMALFANGGRFTSKPYVATGQYIQRMSNYCDGCAYDPKQRTGPRACPYTTLFWLFIEEHEHALLRNPRTAMMARNLGRFGADERQAIRACGRAMLEQIESL